MNDLHHDIKQLIINSLNLEDIAPADIDSNAPLFGDDGLGLDSVDALELGLAVQKHFGFQISSENQELRESFQSVATLADFVAKQRSVS